MKIIEDIIEEFKFKKLKELEEQEEKYKYGKDIVDNFLSLTEAENDLIKEKSKHICIILDRDYAQTAEMICMAVLKSNEESIKIMQTVGITFYVEDFEYYLESELTVEKGIRKMMIDKLKDIL